MSIWNDEIESQLKNVFENLKSKVYISFYESNHLDDENKKEMAVLLEGLSRTSKNLVFKKSISDSYKLKIAIGSDEREEMISFVGLPGGHEFTSFILAILQVGKHPVKIEESFKNEIVSVDFPKLEIKTFYSLTCHNCPEVIQALNIISVLNKNVSHVALDGQIVQEEVKGKGIMATPSVWINGEVFHHGRASIEELWSLIIKKYSQETKKEAQIKNTKVLVIGGGPAGLSSAIYTARKGIDVLVVAERLGGQVADTMGIENWIGVSYTEGPKLTKDLINHAKEYNIPLIQGVKVEEMVWSENENKYKVSLSNGDNVFSEQVILATGAKWKSLSVPGEEYYKNKGVAYCPHCDGPLFKGKKVVVIGGGNSGVEAAIDLAGIVKEVVLIEYDDKLKADKVLQEKLSSLKNTKVITNAKTISINGDGNKVEEIVYLDRKTEEQLKLQVDGIFIQIGLIPNTQFINIEKNKYGEILVDEKGRTSLKNVYAAGDASTTPFKQIVVAIGSGATAALSAFEERNTNF